MIGSNMLSIRYKSYFRNPSSPRESYDVNDEYTEVFRTKSYGETWEKIRSQLGLSRRSLNRVGPSSSSSSSSSSITSSSLPRYSISLSNGILLQEQEDFLVDKVNVGSKVNNLVMEYIKVDLEACKVCERLLHIVQEIKANHRLIKRIIKLAKRVLHDSMSDEFRQECIDKITRKLALYSLLENPLSSFSQVKFRDRQNIIGLLLKKLKTKHRKINRRTKFKKAMGCNLVGSFTRLAFSLLVFIFHKIVEFVVARPLVGGCLGPIKKLQKRAKKAVQELGHGELRQLDVAGRGVYTLMKDFDMMSRLGWRVHDEIEHGKSLADICIRVGNGEVWKEVVKEFESKEIMFLELLEEFEKHIYLSLLNLERSRRQLEGEKIGNDNLSVSAPFLA